MGGVAAMKDRSHYGLLVRDEVLEVTPEQAGAWLNTRPPPPLMWTRGAANNEKSVRLSGEMKAGRWDNDRGWDVENNRSNEPVMIWEDHGCVLGGHHRLTAVSMLDRPQSLRVLFWTKPKGWDKKSADERRALQRPTIICEECGWWSQFPELVDAHKARAHG